MYYYRCTVDKHHIFSSFTDSGLCPVCLAKGNKSSLEQITAAEDFLKPNVFEQKSSSIFNRDNQGVQIHREAKELKQLAIEKTRVYREKGSKIYCEIDLDKMDHLLALNDESEESYERRIIQNIDNEKFILNPPAANASIESIRNVIIKTNQKILFNNHSKIDVTNQISPGIVKGKSKILTPIGLQSFNESDGVLGWEVLANYVNKEGHKISTFIYYKMNGLNMFTQDKKVGSNEGLSFEPLNNVGVKKVIKYNSDYYNNFLPEQIQNLEINYDILVSKIAMVGNTNVVLSTDGMNVTIRKKNVEKRVVIEDIAQNLSNFNVTTKINNRLGENILTADKSSAKMNGTSIDISEDGNSITIERHEETIQISLKNVK